MDCCCRHDQRRHDCQPLLLPSLPPTLLLQLPPLPPLLPPLVLLPPQDPDDIAKVHWSLKRFIAWQQQQQQQQQEHTQAAAAAATAAASQQQFNGPSGPSSGSGSGAAAQTQQQPQQPWQQQQFQQLLGPQLQLLTPAQAAALEAPCLLQQTVAKQRWPASPSKLGSMGCSSSSSSATGPKQQPQQQDIQPLLQQLGAPGVPIGVLAGLLNPCNLQQWMPGGGCLWDSLQAALLEVLVSAARLASAPVDAWEAAATLLR
jgi:hypothetical protein